MASESYFLTKTEISREELIVLGGNPAIDGFATLRERMFALGGAEAAELFAEPVFKKSNGNTPLTITW